MAVLLVLVFIGLIALSLWAIVDASLRPDREYEAAGLSKGWVTFLLVLTCSVGALVYFAILRPRLTPPVP